MLYCYRASAAVLLKFQFLNRNLLLFLALMGFILTAVFHSRSSPVHLFWGSKITADVCVYVCVYCILHLGLI